MATKSIPVTDAATFGIHRVYIQDLFGRYTYDLVSRPTLNNGSRLMIFYGDNGSGKTTLLQLIAHLLTHIDGQGHKARVADIPFRYLLVEVGNFRIEAVRSDISHRGFTGRVSNGSGVLAEADYYKKKSKGDTPKEKQRHESYLKALKDINVGIFFLADDRTVTSNFLSDPDAISPNWVGRVSERIIQVSEAGGIRYQLEPGTRRKVTDVVLENAIARVNAWCTQKALTGSTQGEEDVNSIYSRIIQRLASSSRKKTTTPMPQLSTLLSTLEEQARRSQEFSQFGLTSPPKVSSLVAAVTRAPRITHDVIAKVLGPYIDSMKARLDALQEIQQSISAFISTVNSFYRDKKVIFDLRTGLSIKTDENTALKPTMLSSGERQLLLLFCNILVVKERPNIFLIDEPELSLNVKWQRELVSSLLAATKDSQMQFILATHSIELLTLHKHHVVTLDEKPKLLTN